MPTLKTASHKTESIQIGSNAGSLLDTDADLEDNIRGGKWEDEEERRFFEDIPDLKDYVPKGILGVEEESVEEKEGDAAEKEKQAKAKVDEEVRQLEEELAGLELSQSEDIQDIRQEEAKSQDDEPVGEDDE